MRANSSATTVNYDRKTFIKFAIEMNLNLQTVLLSKRVLLDDTIFTSGCQYFMGSRGMGRGRGRSRGGTVLHERLGLYFEMVRLG